MPADAAHSHDDHDHEHAHDHEHDHEHAHGPVLNPDCTRELVLDVPAEDVSKSFRRVTREYQKYAKIPGFRPGKVPEPVVKRKFANEIRKEVIDSSSPGALQPGGARSGRGAGGAAAGHGTDRGRRIASACESGFRVHSRFLHRGISERDRAQASGRDYRRGSPARTDAAAGIARHHRAGRGRSCRWLTATGRRSRTAALSKASPRTRRLQARTRWWKSAARIRWRHSRPRCAAPSPARR